MSKMADSGYTFITGNKRMIAKMNDEVYFEAKRVDNLYLWSISEVSIINNINNVSLWHQRSGHLNSNTLKKMQKENIVLGLDNEKISSVKPCNVCNTEKLTRKPFPISTTKSDDLLELVHSDFCGPMEKESLGKSKYYVIFIDDYSRMKWVYFVHHKSEVINKFKIFKAQVENQLEKKIKTLRTDNGGEYFSKEFNKYLEVNGIIHQHTVPYTPEQNGVAERANRSIVEMARCLLKQKSLPKEFWAEAVNTAVYIKNRSSTIRLHMKYIIRGRLKLEI